MEKTFTKLLIPYIIGILVFYFIDISSSIIIFIFLISTLYIFYNIIKSGLNQSILLYFFFILGVFVSLLHGSENMESLAGEEIYIKAVVEDMDKKTSEIERYIIKVKEINGNKTPRERSLLTIIGQADLSLGSTISFKSSPKIPMENTNPGLFNYRLHLKSKSIYTTMSLNSHDIENVDNSNISFRYKLKENSIDKVEKLFQPYLNEENNSIISSIILGDSDYLDESNIRLYRDMGLAHILAVSGLHIGIISSFLIFVMSRLGIKRRTNTILTLAFIWIYGFIIGYPPSILRASILFSFLYLSKIVHRPYDSLNILSLAAIILLLANPYNLFSVGFQLSFIASASILVFTRNIIYLLYPLEGKSISTISSLIAVNIGVTPVQAYYFNRISMLGFLANIIIVPILSFSLILGFLMIGVEFIIPSLNYFFGMILNFSLNLQFFVLRILGKIPVNIIRVFSPETITILYIFILFFIIFEMIDIKSFNRSIQKTILVYLLFLIGLNMMSIKENMEIHFIDVGQGDSAYIRSGKKDILIDTGGSLFKNSNIPERIVLPYLEKIGVRKLDAIFISHFHEDHCEGLPQLLNSFKVEHVFISHIPEEGEYLDSLGESRLTLLRQGDSIDIDRHTSFQILWPVDDIDYEDNINNKSIVSILKYRDRKVLFTGDIELEVENSLLKDMGKVDILKVAHHGSDTSSTQEFIDIVDPEVGIISVGEKNTYNHPSLEVLDRFEGRTKIYRTDRDGLIKVLIEDGYEVNPYLVDGKKVRVGIEDYLFYNYNYFLYNLLFFVLSYIFIRKYWEEVKIIEL